MLCTRPEQTASVAKSARSQRVQVETAMRAPRPANTAAAGVGPRAALRTLALDKRGSIDIAEWLEEARLDAILGGCKLSLPSWRSGVRCYLAFTGEQLAVRIVVCCVCSACTDKVAQRASRYFPPKLEHLLAWSTLFRCEGTWSNYLGYVRTACVVVKASTKVACLSHL